jgi:HSP20 family molecular chaperone IbpA
MGRSLAALQSSLIAGTSFNHTRVSLPAAVSADKVTAAYKDGVLTVEIPKAEEAKPKSVEVKVS